MNVIKLILTIILMFVLWNLYHKMFHVVYFDALSAIFTEFVVCFAIAAFIVFKGFSMIGSLFTPKEKDPGFYGTYHNLALLEDGSSDTLIRISGGDNAKDGKMRIFGLDEKNGNLNFTVETTIPDGNTFTCFDSPYNITLTITADPQNHTLEVVQETSFYNTEFPFTGSYVDDDTWERMKDQVNVAKDTALAAQNQNQWIDDYPSDPQSNDAVVPEIFDPVDYTPPESSDAISSDNRDDYPSYTDTLEEPPEYYWPENEPRSWDGVYTCTSDGPDGSKTLTITQTSDSTLSISLYHLYADGREDSLDIVADVGTYNNGQYFASYEDEKRLYFTLADNSTVDVSQLGIYPAIDLEFFGTYVSEN